MKKTTLRQSALRLALVALAVLAPLGLRAQQTLPYSYGFEDNDLSTDGWVAQVSSSYSGIKSEATQTGSYGFRFNYTENPGYLMSPIFTGNTSAVTVTFSYKEYSSSYGDEQFQVGYTTDETVTDPSAFTYGAVVTASTSWQDYEETFPAGTKRIAIKYIYTDALYLYLDDFTFEVASSCTKPTGLAATLTPGNGTIATLIWTAGATETNWVLEYGTASDFTGATSVNVSGTPTANLTGLTAETPYYARVKSDCGGDYSNWSTGISFTPTNAFSLTVNDGTETNQYVPFYGYYADATQQNQMIIPAADLAAMTGGEITQMVFYIDHYSLTSSIGNWIVSLGETSATTLEGLDNTTTLTEVYSGAMTFDNASDPTIMTVTFTDGYVYNGGNLLVQFNHPVSAGYSQYYFTGVTATGASYCYNSQRNFLPKVTFGYESNAYPKPKNLAVTNLTANGATITWEAPNSDVQSYEYQYREQGGTWSALTSTTTLSAPLSGLTGNTTYEFQVQALYAGDNESGFASKSFTTPCAAFSVDPTAYIYGFEDVADMDCWTLVNGETYTDVWDNATMQSNFEYEPARTGDNVFMFYYVDYDDTDPEYQTLISPELTDVPTTGLHVEFYYVGDMDGSGQETFRVGYSTTDKNLSSFTWGAEITNASTAYQRFSANYPAGTKYVAIQHTSDDQYYLFIDDITFEGAAACLEPTAVAANNITTTGAEISWTNGGEETAWDIFVTNDNTVVPDDLTTPTVAGTSTKPYPLTGLTHSTTYYVYVRSACISTEHSAWSTPLTFHTECEGMDLPYSYGFEDGALSVCWNVLNTNTSYNNVTIGDGNANTGTHSLNFFRGSTEGDMVAVLPEVGAYDLSDYQFEFSAKGAYAGYEITVGIMTDPDDFTTFVPQGTTISTTTDYAEYKVRFNEYTGSGKYVAISVVRPSTVTYGYIYIDDIAINPIPSCIEPDDLAISAETAHGATFGWTSNGTESEWQLYISENSTAPADDINVNELIPATTNPFVLTSGLNAETEHYVWVRANCGTDGYSTWVGPETFTTTIACPAPTNLDVDNITGHTADLTWDGTSASYNIDYRTAAYLNNPTFSEEFSTSSLPTGWNRSNTALTDNVLNGTTALSLYSSGWINTSYGLGAYNWKMNIYNTSKYWLITPSTTLGNDYILSFDAAITAYNSNNAPSSSNVADANSRFVVLITTDNMATWTILREWNNTGSADVLNNISNTGNNFTIDLSSYAGESVNIAFYGGQAVSGPDCDLHIDNVAIGEAVAAGEWQHATSDVENKQLTGLNAETKYEVQVQGDCGSEGPSQWTASTFFTTDIACMAPTTLAAGTPGPNSVDLTWTKTGTETAWQICLNGDETHPIDVAESEVTITGTTVAYTLDGLTAETPYTVKVRANCGGIDGQSAWSNEESFTTAADCPVPVLAAAGITNVSGHTADVAWTGFPQNDSYKVWYRSAEYFNGIEEGFGTTLPTGWENKTGLLSTIMDGGSFSTSTQWVFGTNNGVFDNHARINIYGNSRYGWLITPIINVSTGFELSFDLALTAYSGTGAASGTCEDDRFVVLVTTDNEATWTILREWNNSGSTDVYNDIPTAGTNVNIDLTSYIGQSVKIAFYGESTTTGNGDNNLHIDNVVCGIPVAAGTWHNENVDAPATSTTLTGLDPETPYEVYVTGHCATGNVTTDASATQTFTTTVACPAPVLADVDPATITTTTATLTWTGSAASNFTVAYKTAIETDFTEVPATSSPFTFAANTLSPATVYTVKVKAVCGGSDGESEWSNTKTFTTECDAVAADGWSENFDDDATGSLPICWNRINEGTSYTSYPYVTSSNPNSTPNTLYFYTYGSSTSTSIADQYAVLPEMTGLAGMRFTLQARGYNANSNFKVGLMSDPTDASTFMEITNDGNPTITTGYQEYYFDIPTTATESHVAIMMPKPTSTSSSTYSVYIDDISIAPIPSCQKPTAPEVTATTATTATLSWTENGSATAWQICINNDETNLIDANTNPFTVPGLTPATTYTAKVRANCNATEQSEWSNTIQFTTDCEAITTFPWSENFENFTASTVPTCWDNSASTSSTLSNYPERIWGVYEYSSNKMIRMYNYYVDNGTALINTPSIELPTSGDYALSFDYAHNASCGNFTVKVSTDNGANFTDLASYSKGSGSSYSNPGDFTPATISLADYAGESIILQFFANANYGNGAIFVDNIKIDLVHTITATANPAAGGTITGAGDYTHGETATLNATANDGYRFVNWTKGGAEVSTDAEYSFTVTEAGDYVANFAQDSYNKVIEGNMWYAIASPVHNSGDNQTLAGVDYLTNVANDLYGYNEEEGTWQRASILEQGKGYIYRRATGTTLKFNGVANSSVPAYTLSYACADDSLKGFNLVGNPYPQPATPGMVCYSLTPNGTWESHVTYQADVCEAVLVKTSGTGNSVTFTTGSGAKGVASALAFTVSNEEFEDVAYARFDNGEGLPKIGHLTAEAPMLSIPVDSRRYAIANVGNDCESFNLAFRGTNGSYTLTLKDNMAQMGYVHLIDRATGRDIDMLRQSYTFSATGNDADRFTVKLSPDAIESTEGHFAYWNGDNWVVEGNGKLQVIDVVGRQVLSQEVDSQTTLSNAQFPGTGVYILRMAGKSQKIVVK